MSVHRIGKPLLLLGADESFSAKLFCHAPTMIAVKAEHEGGRKPRLVWLDAGHISAAQFLFGEMQRLKKFFEPKSRAPTKSRVD